MEREFGTGGALASAFVSGFYPLRAVKSENLETTAAGSPKFPCNDTLMTSLTYLPTNKTAYK
ncbi:hypothetical protein [Paenibacillus monticola]|uniref:Uncharacterized protein n=1 Tax=Paenibacillus monticola TaxID=2666075 RepID=A0A7X2H4X8_9BACL|nr:hypothetical protein [Paenibacillus monticola]MRN53599.1 hypothetical protein [Paenibacillus monticola]